MKFFCSPNLKQIFEASAKVLKRHSLSAPEFGWVDTVGRGEIEAFLRLTLAA
jgi:hypothetical protein